MPKRNSPSDESDNEDSFLITPAQTNRNSQLSNDSDHHFAGTIKSIVLINFMSHKNTSLEFGTKINFVTGRNGSGKSAILTAIITCLGGKVSFTNRANSFKSLIKEGETVAQITMSIRNSGPDAYKPDEFGDSIIIERKLSLDSSSGFKIKTSGNKLISSKKEELLAICDHFGIQVNNPLNILTQDASRQFIGSTSAEDKYYMFLKGTQLSQLSEDHAIIKDTIIASESVLKNKEDAIPELRQQVKKAELKYRSMKQAQELHKNLDHLKKEMAWAQVVEIEQIQSMARNRVEKSQNKLTTAEEKLAEETVSLKSIEAKVSTVNEALEELKRKEAPIQQDKNKLQDLIKEKSNEKRKLEGQMRQIDSSLRIERKKLENIEQKIVEETEKSKRGIEQMKKEVEQKIKEKQKEIDDVKEEKNKCSTKAFETENEISSVTKKVESKKSELDELKSKGDNLSKTIQQIQTQKSDGLKAFGNSIPQVLQAIEKENRWKKKPIGPFGQYVKLADPIWSDTIESYLGQGLNAFLVENFQDQRLLSSILLKLRCESRIFVSQFDEFDFSHGEPSKDYLTVLRALKFDNPWVMRQLIINNKIEKTILMTSRSEADKLMTNPPKNVIACFTNEGFQVGHKGGGFSTSTLPPYNGPPRLVQNLQAKLDESQKELRQIKEACQRMTDELNNLKIEVKEKEFERATLYKERSKFELKIKQIYSQIEQLNQELLEIQPSNVSVFETAKKDAEYQIDMIKNQFIPLSEKNSEISKQMEEHMREIDELKEKMAQSNTQIVAAKTNIDQIISEKLQIQQKIDYWKGKIEEIQKYIDDHRKELENVNEQVKATTEQALDYAGERISVSKTASTLDREIKQLEKQLKLATDELGNTLEECAADLSKKLDALKELKHEMQMASKFVSDLKQALKIRQRRWNDFRGFIAKRARKNFEWNLTQRGFSGRLEFDHDKKKLVPYVQPSDETRASKGHDRDPKSLSGGEKSYSTISLLLALWEAMGCPIRCLDEYDVFMDAANRSVTTKMIVECASHTVGVQHILISPQNLPHVHKNPHCRILKLDDPERNGRFNNQN